MAKAAGNSYPLSPTVTAPVADSTPMIVTALDRFRERVSTGFVESAINTVVGNPLCQHD